MQNNRKKRKWKQKQNESAIIRRGSTRINIEYTERNHKNTKKGKQTVK